MHHNDQKKPANCKFKSRHQHHKRHDIFETWEMRFETIGTSNRWSKIRIEMNLHFISLSVVSVSINKSSLINDDRKNLYVRAIWRSLACPDSSKNLSNEKYFFYDTIVAA